MCVLLIVCHESTDNYDFISCIFAVASDVLLNESVDIDITVF